MPSEQKGDCTKVAPKTGDTKHTVRYLKSFFFLIISVMCFHLFVKLHACIRHTKSYYFSKLYFSETTIEVETKTSTLESSFASQFSEVSGVMPLPRQCRALLGDNTTRGSSLLNFSETSEEMPSSGSSSLPSTILMAHTV